MQNALFKQKIDSIKQIGFHGIYFPISEYEENKFIIQPNLKRA